MPFTAALIFWLRNARVESQNGSQVSYDINRFNVVEFREKIRQRIKNDKDIAFLIQMYLRYGNNVNRIINSPHLSKVTSTRFMILTKTYGIRRKATGHADPTLSRIAISFPEVVAVSLTVNPNIPGLITLEQLRLVSDYSEFPSLGRVPLLACFLPRTHAESLKILNVFFLAKMMVSENIHIRSKDWCQDTKQQRAMDSKVYQMYAFNSPLYNETQRKNWCTCFKIMEGDDYSEVWKEAAVKCKAVLEETYGFAF